MAPERTSFLSRLVEPTTSSPLAARLVFTVLMCLAVLLFAGRAHAGSAPSCCTSTGACTLQVPCPAGTTASNTSTCTPNPCPQPGTCCTPTVTCTFVIAASCASPNVWTLGGACTPNPCTNSGRCCNITNGGCAIMLQSACGLAGHTWSFGGTCAPNTCDQPGACCTGQTCRRLVQSRCAAPAIWFRGVTCSPNPCPIPFAAAWSSSTSSARAVATFDLAQPPALANPGNNGSGFGTILCNLKIRVYGASSGNGTWTQADFNRLLLSWDIAINTRAEWVGQPQGSGHWGMNGSSDFNIFNSTTGAPNGVAPNTLGTNGGSGPTLSLTSFAPLPASRVACCADDGSCTFTTSPECLVAGGTPQAAGSSCAPSPCTNAGRCCNFLTGSCVIASLPSCGSSSHTWTFGGVCSPNPCPPIGACCTTTSGICRQITQDRCSGSWTAGVCTPNPCTMTFAARWSNTTTGAKALAVFDLAQPPILLNPGDNSGGWGTRFRNLRVRVYDATTGNGIWSQADFSSIAFHWDTALNTRIEWVGQPLATGRWGMSGNCDFNLFTRGPGVPFGCDPNILCTASGEDLALRSFAPVPPAGACCAIDGSCALLSEPECTVRTGTPLPAGSMCTPTPCPQPGTCCSPTVTCTLSLASACANGSLWTLGGSCSPNPCRPIGPCCNVITGGCAITTEPACGLATHTWTAHGTCMPNACTQPGACCNTSLVCIRRTPDRCTGASQTWTAGACAPSPCTLNGRCCNVMTGTCAITLQSACGAAAHTWAFGGACSPNLCDQPGACCAANTGSCRTLVQSRCTGTSTWSAGACTPNPCFVHFVARWASSTTTARAVATFDLAQPPTLANPGDNARGFGTTFKNLKIRVYGSAAGNGTWGQSDFTNIYFRWPVALAYRAEWVGQPQDNGGRWGVGASDPNFQRTHDFNLMRDGGPSLAGASPYASTEASALPTPASAPPVGTTYYELSANGEGGVPMLLTSFAPAPTTLVACCSESGVCTRTLEPDCMIGGGTPQGPNSVCAPNPCDLSGRCCNIVTGSCAITSLAACGPASHSWTFSGACSPNTCDLPGACCTAESCRRLTQARCTGTSVWLSNSACAPNPCLRSLERAKARCPADFDGSGAVDAADLFAFLNAWLSGDARADVDDTPGLDQADILDFTATWFAGCP